MNEKKFRDLYNRILSGDKANIKYTDACDFVEKLGFAEARQNGTSHRIFKMSGIPDIINLQEQNGNAKPYQVGEIKKIIKKYKLGGDDNVET